MSYVAILLITLSSVTATHAWGDPELRNELMDKEAKKRAEKEAKADRKRARQEAKLARKEWKKKIKELKKRGFQETEEAYKEDGGKTYQEIKVATKSLLIDGVKIFLPKNIYPEIKWYNTAAPPDVCDLPGFASVHNRFKVLFNGVLKSRNFNPVEFELIASSSDFLHDHTRNLRGNEKGRELSGSCAGYFCNWYGGGRRRLWGDKDEELPAVNDVGNVVASFGEAEMQLNELKVVIEEQCHNLLTLVAHTDRTVKTLECREAIAASICETKLPVWENVDIGEEE